MYLEWRDWGTQVKNSPSARANERQWRPIHIIMRVVLELGIGNCTLVTQVLGWRALQFFWTAFESCNNPFFKGVTWQQRNGWYLGIG